MVNLMNITREECAVLVSALEKEQCRLQLEVDRSPGSPEATVNDNDRRQEMIRRLLLKARAGSSTADILDPSELIEYRLGGYC